MRLRGGFLKIGVHRDDERSPRLFETGAVGGGFSEVPAKLNDLHP
jgi:hypothetical protein